MVKGKKPGAGHAKEVPPWTIEELGNMLYRYKTYDSKLGKYSSWIYVSRSSVTKGRIVVSQVEGELVLYLDCLTLKEREDLTKELAECRHLGAHPIQGTTEPRRHFLVHEDAAENDTAFADESIRQPGYSYAGNSITLKARSFKNLPHLRQASDKMKEVCDVKKWTIGVNPILYRNHSDSISPHADNNQGESFILSLVVKQADDDINLKSRRVVKIQPQQKTPKHGQAIVDIYLKEGDAYSMDGELQKHCFHSVPKIEEPKKSTNTEKDSSHKRVAIIFRCGKSKLVYKDTGHEGHLAPKVPVIYTFGNCIFGLVEGQTYSKHMMREIGAHMSLQKGVSGNKHHGCNAIACSGGRHPDQEVDHGSTLTYCADFSNGGEALLVSFLKGRCIRVFRANVITGCLRATSETENRSKHFRYDGLYKIVSVGTVPQGATTHSWIAKPNVESLRYRLCCFRLYRVESGKGPDCNRLPDAEWITASMRAKTMSFPSSNCPCHCTESNACTLLESHNGEELFKFFEYPNKVPRHRRSCVTPDVQTPVDDSTEGDVPDFPRNNRKRRYDFLSNMSSPLGMAAVMVTTSERIEWVLAEIKRYDQIAKLYFVEDADGSGSTFRVPESQLARPCKKHLVPGTVCLAVYPGSTTFYPAEVKWRQRRKESRSGSGYEWLEFEGEEYRDRAGQLKCYHVPLQNAIQLPKAYLRSLREESL